jgi:flagellin
MALAIATNNAALHSAAAASSVNRDMETSMARLSTGLRINSARDDAAGVAIASRLSSEIRGTDQAIRNAMDGQALIDTAEGGHKEIENILQRMREIAIQSANDTNDDSDRDNLNAEMKALTTEIDRAASVTTWAGQTMMSSTGSSFSFQVGTATGSKNQISITINSMSTSGLGVDGTGTRTASDIVPSSAALVHGTVDATKTIFTLAKSSATVGTAAKFTFEDAFNSGSVEYAFSSTTTAASTTPTDAQNAVMGAEIAAKINSDAQMVTLGIGATADKTTGAVTLNFKTYESVDSKDQALNAVKNIDAAIKLVNTQRSELGAVSNRLSHTVNNLTNISSNLSAAKGGIEDADFAFETTNLAKNQILQQASTAMLAQANASKQNVLSLLQG